MYSNLGERLRELPNPVLVTGHTGFKGTWLTLLLERLEVPVIGLSLSPLENSLFARAHRTGAIPEAFLDIRDFDSVQQFMSAHKPSAVIHMAAQALVLESYKTPRVTFETNVMGTANILAAAFKVESVQAVEVITTDKVYRNDNSGTAFVETDALEGKDPYSASKVAAEAAIAAWQQIAKVAGGPKVFSVRAGNVIGGGDWAEDRLIPDLVRSFVRQSLITVRNPESTRPWEHVLDPLCGYVLALESVLNGNVIKALNFGPDSESLSVKEIVELSTTAWPLKTSVEFSKDSQGQSAEAKELQLNSSLARKVLGWQPRWSQDEAVLSTISWWDKVLNRGIEPSEACKNDIDFLLSK